MADKKQASSEKTVVTRIKATEPTPSAKKQKKKTDTKKIRKVRTSEERPTKNPIVNFWRYVKGAWQELRQVHWPTRQATWSMTGAVLAFSAIFAALILLLDAGFQLLFEQILK